MSYPKSSKRMSLLWVSVAAISVMLVMSACDLGGGSAAQPGQAAVSQPQSAPPKQDNVNPVATAYRPGGQPTPHPTEVIPPAPPLPAITDKTLLVDNFSHDSIANYSIVDLGNGPDNPLSSWLVQDNALLQNGDANGNPASNETLALTGDASWQNYSVEVEAYGGSTPVGPIARYSAAGFYRLRVNRSTVAGAGWLLQRYDASKGDYTTLAKGTAGSGYAIQKWNYLKLTVQGSTISANINGQNVASVTDASYSAGKVGVYAEATWARFSNLRVTALQ